MNYNEIEKIVLAAKMGNSQAKESLVEEFTPLILNLSRKSSITSYEPEDIRNECYKTLFKCVEQYASDKHRFVAYATNAIKNSVNELIRKSVRRCGAEGMTALISSDKLDNSLFSAIEGIDNFVINRLMISQLQNVLNSLYTAERELITHVYFKGYSLKRYSEIKALQYSEVLKRRANILRKLRSILDLHHSKQYLN